MYEIRYMGKLKDKYNMESIISREIILYSRKVNQGLLLYWFMDRVAEYLYTYNPKNAEATKKLLETFHEKYVVPFGR